MKVVNQGRIEEKRLEAGVCFWEIFLRPPYIWLSSQSWLFNGRCFPENFQHIRFEDADCESSPQLLGESELK